LKKGSRALQILDADIKSTKERMAYIKADMEHGGQWLFALYDEGQLQSGDV
jgi:hypothetical protein